jgi:hypothetical protein
MTLVPVLFLSTAEIGLRAIDFGYQPEFFVRLADSESYTTNTQFGRRFFPRRLVRTPAVCKLSADKPEGTYRIFVLGGSAAMGIPLPAFGLPSMLQAVLEQRAPERRYEVINAAMTAVNSHVALVIARDCARFAPDLFVVYLGNNEVVGPYGSGTIFGGSSPYLSVIRGSIAVRATRLGQALDRMTERGQGPAHWKGMEMFLGNRVPADDPRMAHVYGHYRRNLQDICRVANECGAKTILCTVPVNLKHCPPFASLHGPEFGDETRRQWDEESQAAANAEANGDLAAAVARYEESLRLDDRYAEQHFRLGSCLLKLGRFEDAREHFVQARDLDALRFRADSQINEIVRDVATATNGTGGVYLVDTERAFAEANPGSHGLPGRKYFYEHVHLTPEGNFRVADEVVDLMVEELHPVDPSREESERLHATLGRSCELLGLTPSDRLCMMKEMLELQQSPPFMGSLWRARVEEFEQEVNGLEMTGSGRAPTGGAADACRQALGR